MRSNIFKHGFLSLVVTQFFGAANDNIQKGVLSFGVALGGLWASALGEGGQGYVGLCLTVPFILFSGYAGQIADRISKQRMTVIAKVAEVFIALIALIGFMQQNLWICLLAMLLLAIQSTFFGPAKYGMIPELVDDAELSRANGTINMSTNIAIIAGTLAAGPVYSLYHPESDPLFDPNSGLTAQLWLPGLVLLGVAVLGLVAALFMPRLKAQDPELTFDWNPVGTYWKAMREMAGGPLVWVALSWAFFYMIGMIAILILPDYKALLGISATQASVLLGILGMAIGIGSVTAGLVSGRRIEPRLVPIGAVGMAVFFILLGVTPLNYWLVAALLFGGGVFAGFYIIPLQSLLQFLSPDDERGRFLGTANAISFVFSTMGSLIFLFARKTLGMDANHVFLLCGIMALAGTTVLIYQLRKLINDPDIRRASHKRDERTE